MQRWLRNRLLRRRPCMTRRSGWRRWCRCLTWAGIKFKPWHRPAGRRPGWRLRRRPAPRPGWPAPQRPNPGCQHLPQHEHKHKQKHARMHPYPRLLRHRRVWRPPKPFPHRQRPPCARAPSPGRAASRKAIGKVSRFERVSKLELGTLDQKPHAAHAIPFVGVKPERQSHSGGQRLGVAEPDGIYRLALVLEL